jgi:hypothetical protein
MQSQLSGAGGVSPGSVQLCPVNAAEHPTWDPFLYILDVLIPIAGLGHEKAWDPTGTALIAAAGRALSRS